MANDLSDETGLIYEAREKWLNFTTVPWLENENFLPKFRGNFNTITRSIFVMNRRNIVCYRISFSFKVLIFSNFPTGRKIRSSRKINRQNVAKGRESRLRKRLENTDLAYNFVYGSGNKRREVRRTRHGGCMHGTLKRASNSRNIGYLV